MNTAFTPARARLTVAQFQRMGDAGVLPRDARLELIDGEMLEMAPIGPHHASVVSTLSMLFARCVGDASVVWTQNPLVLTPDSEPQPDICLLKPRADRYRDALPAADDALLVIEVADTTLQFDRTTKLSLYARHAVREVWIVDLEDRIVEIYRDPSAGAYRTKLERAPSDTVAPVALTTAELRLADVF